jgi:hypothetical protein
MTVYGSVKVLLRFFSFGRKVSLLSLVHKITTPNENNHTFGTFINGGKKYVDKKRT